jgi:hypothetical protein
MAARRAGPLLEGRTSEVVQEYLLECLQSAPTGREDALEFFLVAGSRLSWCSSGCGDVIPKALAASGSVPDSDGVVSIFRDFYNDDWGVRAVGSRGLGSIFCR